MSRLPRFLRLPFRTGRIAREVDDELRFHLESRTAQLRAQGMTSGAARAEALRQFGDVDDARRYCRDQDIQHVREQRAAQWWGELARDLRHSVRGLRRQPGFTLAVVITIALGIGANIVMFGTVDRLLLRPPPGIAAPNDVKRVYLTLHEDGADQTGPHISWPQYVELRDAMRSVTGIAAYISTNLPVGEGAAARKETVTLATASYLPMLGVRPILGRVFTDAEDVAPLGSAVAVISHDLWTRRFGADPRVIGTTVPIGGHRFEIIGVAPPGLSGVDLGRTVAWVPVSALAGQLIDHYTNRSWHVAAQVGWLRAIVRTRHGASLAEPSAQATAAYTRSMEKEHGAAGAASRRPRASLEPLLIERGPDRTPSARIAVWLAGMAVVVLLIACANVANLLLARGLRRRREIAVRVALGAGRGRLVRQMLAEGLLLAVLGGAGALLVARWGGAFVGDILMPGIGWERLVDSRMLLFTAGATIVTGVLTALVPALQVTATRGGESLSGSLRTGGRDGGGRRSLTRRVLVVAQAALSLVLLVGAGLFLRSLHRAQQVQLGFAPDEVLLVDLDIASTDASGERMVAIYDQLLERVQRLPGVRHAALSVATPFSTTISTAVRLPGRDSVVPPADIPRVNAVTADYFATLGTRVLEGRPFRRSDVKGAAGVVVVNQTTARRLWPGHSPLGECVILGENDTTGTRGLCLTVVGVAEDARWDDLRAKPPLQIYVAMEQKTWTFPMRALYVSTPGGIGRSDGIVRGIQREARNVGADVLFAQVDPLARNLDKEMRPWRLGATVFTVFGVLALVLATLGLYSVIAYDVARQMREMGIRIALGARAPDVIRLVVGDAVRLAVIGVVIGGVIAVLVGRRVGAMLFDTTPNDPVVLGGVAFVLIAVAVAASAIPARRATKVAPGIALRAE